MNYSINPYGTVYPVPMMTPQVYSYPQWGPVAYGNPRMMMPQAYMPATQPLAAPGLNISPNQLEMMKNQLPPQARAEFDKWFADPQVQAQLAQLQSLAQQGKLSPQDLAQMMAGGGMQPPDLEARMREQQLKFKAMLYSILLAIPAGLAFDGILSATQQGKLDGFLKGIEKLPILNKLNQKMTQVITHEAQKPLALQKLLTRLDNNASMDALRKEAINLYTAKGGAYWKEFQNIAKQFPHESGLLSKIQGFNSIGELQAYINSFKTPINKPWWNLSSLWQPYTYTTQTDKSAFVNALESVTKKFDKGLGSLENALLGGTESEHFLMDALRKRQVGPLGRFVGRFIHGLQQVFSGQAVMERMGAAGATATTAAVTRGFWGQVSTTLGRLPGIAFMGYFIFNPVVQFYLNKNTPKESRRARLAQEFFESVAGMMGFFTAPAIFAKTGLLYRHFPAAAKFLDKPFLWKFSRKGTLLMFIAPLLFAGIAKRISNVLFGNPNKIEARLKAKTEAHPLAARQGLFQQLSQPGNTQLPLVPGITPDTQPFVEDKIPFHLSPATIAQSPFEKTSPKHARPLTRRDQYALMDMMYPAAPL